MFKNAIIFRIDADFVMPPVPALEEALGMNRFEPCGASQRESWGWVEPRGEKHGPLVESIGGQMVLKLCVESKMLPSSVVKEEVDKRAEKIKEERGLKRLGGAAKKELKEEVERELLPKAFTKKGATRLWVNAKDGFVVVDAGSVKKADRIIGALVDAMAQVGAVIKLRPLQTQMSPAVAMAHWLTTQEAPAQFSVDRDCELKSTDGEKSVVRYSRHTLDIKEVVEHIEVQGKSPTKLAMTHAGRVSFTLADDLSLKKVELLDAAKLDASEADSGFDADVAIFTGEMNKLLPDLILALDGEYKANESGGDASESSDELAATSDAVDASAGCADAAVDSESLEPAEA